MTTPDPRTLMTYGALAQGDENDARLAQEVDRTANTFAEIGLPGLRRASGYLDEEFLPQLKGTKAVQIYREMWDNDPMTGAMMFAVEQLLRDVEYTVQPAGKSVEDNKAARFLEECMQDMSHSWADFIGESISACVYGWAWHNIVYKRRINPWDRDPRRKSQYTDGMIGWRKMPIRSQDTLLRWLIAPDGSIQGMVQLSPPTYQTTVIPIERSMLFRYGTRKNSPEGTSMFRRAYRPYFYRKRIEEFESIGIERDLAGLPKVGVPASYYRAAQGSDQYKTMQTFIKMVRGVRRNEQEGIVFPIEYDPETRQPMFTFDLVNSGGSRQFDTNTIITRYKQDQLMTIMADFLLVGHQQTGTYNMHVDKTAMFRAGLNAIANERADVLNRFAIPRLFAINGWKPEHLPKIVASDVDAPDLAQLAQFLSATAGIGFNWAPDAELDKFLRNAAGLPALGREEYDLEEVISRREDAIRDADSLTRYVASRSQLAQQLGQQEMMASGTPSPADAQSAQQAQASQQQAQVQGQQQQEQHDMSVQQGKLQLTQQRMQMMQGVLGGGQGGGSQGGKAAGKQPGNKRGQ